MAWTAPRTWVSGEVVTAAIMNTHIRDNELYLFIQSGTVSLGSVVNGGTASGTVTFATAFSSTPVVVVTINSGNIGNAQVIAEVDSVGTTSFHYTFFNQSGVTYTTTLNWIAKL